MKRWLPFPGLFALLLLAWLVLNESASVAQILVGALVAGVAAFALSLLHEPARARLRPRLALELTGVVLADVVRSNIAVARIVLHPRLQGRHAGFVRIPLTLRSPAGLAALACIITATPGTSWAGYEPDSGVLTMHILDLVDEAVWIETIQDRYERRLRAIFE